MTMHTSSKKSIVSISPPKKSISKNALGDSMAQQSPEVEKVLVSESISSNTKDARHGESHYSHIVHNERHPTFVSSNTMAQGCRSLCEQDSAPTLSISKENKDLMEFLQAVRTLHAQL